MSPRSEIPTIVNCIVLGKLESYYGTYQAVKSLTTVGTLESDSKKKEGSTQLDSAELSLTQLDSA